MEFCKINPCPAFTSRQRTSVSGPNGQWPSKVDHKVNGDVKLHS
jgi:hypothetical protein